MEVKPPKRKKTSQKLQHPLPGFRVHPLTDKIILSDTYYGVFNGFGVTVSDLNAIDKLYNNGFFGKGSLSRSVPQLLSKDKKSPQILKQRQFNNREKLKKELNPDLDKFIILPDSDGDDIETDINILKSTFPDISNLIKETEQTKETLLLTLEEAFFLAFGVGCLKIKNELDQVLSLEDIWNLFITTQSDFVVKYVVYHHLRSKQWVVKSGLKYGSDFLLYKDGPVFYHASFAVKIQIFYDDEANNKTLTRNQVSALTRLASSSGKEVLLAQVYYPNNFNNTLQNICDIKVEEVLLKRIFLKDMMVK